MSAKPIPVKKLTVSEIVGKDFLKTLPKEHTLLCYIYGAVTAGVQKGTKFKGDQKLLIGRFEGIRISDNQQFTSERLYLPDNDYQEQLTKACEVTADGEAREIEFAFMIGWRPQSSSPTGYVYSCEPMTDTRAQDRLSNVRKLLTDSKILERFGLKGLTGPSDARPDTTLKNPKK